MYKISKEKQIKELTSRVTPIVNVNVIVHKDNKFLIGHRNINHSADSFDGWLFPGGRMLYDETPQEAAIRKLNEELPGVKAILKKFVTVIPDKGSDPRAYGICLYYLFDYVEGEPKANDQIDKFEWLTLDEIDNKSDYHELEKKMLGEISSALRYINTNSDELLVQVDKNDQIIGRIEKYKAHSDNEVYHRSALIIVFNSKGEVILHQRSQMKSHHPGKWDVFGGHNNFGNSVEQTAQSELMEELGINTQLKFEFKKLYQDKKQSEFMYVYSTVSDGPYAFDRNEVEQIKAFDVAKLLNHDSDSEFEILPHVFEFLERLKNQ